MGMTEAPPARGGRGFVVPAALVAVCVWGAVGAPAWRALRGRAPGPAAPNLGAAADPVVLFRPRSAAHLARVLDAAWGDLAEEGTVPGIAPLALPHDMAFLDPGTRKRTFLRAVAPHLLKVNRGIAADRRRLVVIGRTLGPGSILSGRSAAFVDAAGRRYGVPEARERLAAGHAAAAVALLLVHVDEVPVRLALAQAAVESGWGASKLAREDSSLFGQCVGRAGRRASARKGPAGLWYARFETLPDGVAAYVRNINRSWAYEEFRRVRAAMRRSGVPLDSVRLADGLLPYSELGERYVARVRAVIRAKEFNPFSGARLAPAAAWGNPPRLLAPVPVQAAPVLALDRLRGAAGA